jgi:SAM-dependent methyltransferase
MKGHRWFAAVYDLMSEGDERALGPIRQRLLGDLRGRVLELGAGTGFSFRYYPPGATVIATEPDPFMLRRAVTRAQALPEPGAMQATIRLVQCAAEALPFRQGVFDTAVVAVVL